MCSRLKVLRVKLYSWSQIEPFFPFSLSPQQKVYLCLLVFSSPCKKHPWKGRWNCSLQWFYWRQDGGGEKRREREKERGNLKIHWQSLWRVQWAMMQLRCVYIYGCLCASAKRKCNSPPQRLSIWPCESWRDRVSKLQGNKMRQGEGWRERRKKYERSGANCITHSFFILFFTLHSLREEARLILAPRQNTFRLF